MNLFRIAAKIARVASRLVNEEALKELEPLSIPEAEKEFGKYIESYRKLYTEGDKSNIDKETNTIVDNMVLVLLRTPKEKAQEMLKGLEDRGKASSDYLKQIKPSRNVESLQTPAMESPAESEEVTKVEGRRSAPSKSKKTVVPLHKLHAFVAFNYNQLKQLRKESEEVLENAFKGKDTLTKKEIDNINKKAKDISPSYGDEYFQDLHYEIARKMAEKKNDPKTRDLTRDDYYASITKMPFKLYLNSFKHCPRSLEIMRQRQRRSSTEIYYLDW